MSEVINLAERRAIEAGDNTLWTPKDCLAAFLRDIESGEIDPKRLIIIYEEATPEGGNTLSAYGANVERSYEIYMASMYLHGRQRASLGEGE